MRGHNVTLGHLWLAIFAVSGLAFAGAPTLGDNGFPTDANYAEGIGMEKAYAVTEAAQDYAGQHLKLVLSGSDTQKNMGAVTAESLWITSSAKTRFRFTAATFQNVKALFLNGVNAWNNSDTEVTLPDTLELTLGSGGSNSDAYDNYKNVLFRVGKTLTVNGRAIVPEGQVAKMAPDNNADSKLVLNGGLFGSGTLRIGGGHGGQPLTCMITGGDFTGTLGLYNDASSASSGTFALDGADLCPVLDMRDVTNGSITVSVAQAMGLGDGSQLTAGWLDLAGIPGIDKAAFTLAPGATVAVGGTLTLNLPVSAKPEGTVPTTYRLFEVPEGAKIEGAFSVGNILFGGEAFGASVSLGADGTLTFLAVTPTLDATALKTVSATYGDFVPAASTGADALLKVGASTAAVSFGVPALNALTFDTSAGVPATLTLTGNLGATAGITRNGPAPTAVIFAPEVGQTLDFGTVDVSGVGPFNDAEILSFEGAGAVRYHLGTRDEAAGKNLTAQIIAQGAGDYTVIDNGDDACMVFDRFSVDRPVITVKGGSALTLQARNFAGWDAAQGSGAFLPGIVTLLDGGADAAQTATLHRIPMPKAGGVCEDNLISPIVFRGHATMTIESTAKVNFYRSSDTEAMVKVVAGATARIAAPAGATVPATMTIRNGAAPIVDVGENATLALDVVLARDGGGEALTLRGGGEIVLTQANTATETLRVAAGIALTLSGEGSTWAGPISMGTGAVLRLVAGATLPAMAVSAEAGAVMTVGEGGILTLPSEKLADFIPMDGFSMEEGSILRILLKDEDYTRGSLTLPEALRDFVPRCSLVAPDGAPLSHTVSEGATLAFENPKAVTFALPTGWELPVPVWASAALAGTARAEQGLVQDSALRQMLDGREAIVANVSGAVNAAVIFGGYPYGSDEKTLSQDVWLKVSGGSFRHVVGGNDMQNYGGKPRHLSGGTVVNLSGGSIDYAYSCNFLDGKRSTITGRHALVIDGEAVLKGSAAASAAIHGSGVTYADATLNLTVRNLQNDNSATDGNGIAPGWTGASNIKPGFLVGGGMSTRSNAPHTVNGDTSVCVELPEGTAGNFSKALIGGNYTTQGGGTLSVSGTSAVRVSAPMGVIFDRDIVGGSRATGSATMFTGTSEVTLTGGIYTGTIVAGSLGTNAKTTGDATLILDGADVSAAAVQPGNVSGTAGLVLKKAAAPRTLGVFDVITSEASEAVLTLPEANTDFSGTTGAFVLDASAVEALTVRSGADIIFVALPKESLAVACPEGADRRLVCTVPADVVLEGMAFTVDGIVVEPRLEGTTLTLEPTVAGPFTATVTEDTEWGSLDWFNAEGERAVSFADALAFGATLKVEATAAIALDGDIPGVETLAVEVAEGAALTFAGAGKLHFPMTLTGAMTLAGSTYAANVTLTDTASTLMLDLGRGSGKHADMVGNVSGEGRCAIRASGGDWDAGASTTSTLFVSRLDVSHLARPLEVGDGLRKIRCAPGSFSVPAGKALRLAKGVQLRQLDTLNASYGFVASPGAHLQDGGWGSAGGGSVRTGYTVNLNGPISGMSEEGESPALFNAYAGTGNVHFNGIVSGDGIATGSWGSGESRAMSYHFNNAANTFSQLLIRNMKLSTVSQEATTVNAKAGGLGGSAIVFGVENGQANKSTLNVNGDNTVASVTATNGGSITLAAGVRLTVKGAADLSGVTALKIILSDDAALPFTALTSDTLTLDASRVSVVNAAGEMAAGVQVVLSGTALVVQALPVPADGHGLTGEALLAVQTAAAKAGFADGFTVEACTSAGKTAGTAADVLACFTGLPMDAVKDEAGERVIIRCDFGLDAFRVENVGAVLVRATIRMGNFAGGATVSLVPTPAESVTVEVAEPPEGEATAGSVWFRVRTAGAETLRLKAHITSAATE